MRRKTFLCLMTLIAAAALTGIAAADHHAIKQSEKEGIGKYLTDAKGMTLYLFKKDSPGKSVCADQCVEKWPLYYRETVAATGLKAEDFGTITREDGKKQTTYKNMPLYYFAGDKSLGDASGQGMGGNWYVVAP